jgi:thiol-disulfide isomerase/thioredoxin
MLMLKKILIGTATLIAMLAVTVVILIASNAAPAVAVVSAAEAVDPSRPFVIKLHGQWCPVCLATKGVWNELADEYAGRANLGVFDFTDDASMAASDAEAKRLGLEGFFNEYAGMTGAIAVIDGGSRETRALIGGKHPTDEYRAAIEASLAAGTQVL